MITGLQADTFIEATFIEREKLAYSDVQLNEEAEILVCCCFDSLNQII